MRSVGKKGAILGFQQRNFQSMLTSEAQKLLNLKRKDTSIKFNEEYKGDTDKHSFLCMKCNNVWITTPNTLKRKGNTGCPKCHKRNLQIKREKKSFSKERGATKLLNRQTLSMNEVNASPENLNRLERTKRDIQRISIIAKNLKSTIILLKKEHKKSLHELQFFNNKKKSFGLILSILLFPIWLWYQFSFSKKNRPFRLNEKKLMKNCNLA